MKIGLTRRLVLAAICAVLACAAAPVLASQPPSAVSNPRDQVATKEPPQQQPGLEGFEPFKGPQQQEQLPAAPMVMTAYAVVWAVLLVYVWSLWRRIGAMARDLDELSRRVRDTERPT